MRTFIAIKIPNEIQTYLSTLQNSFPNKGFSKTNSVHLTLKFLGEIDKSELNNLKETLRQVKFNPVWIHLSNLDCFPNKNHPRVLFVGINPEDEIIALQKEIERVLEPFNFKKDFKFHPHLTIARIKFLSNKDTFANKLTQEIEPKEMIIKSFSLYKSTLTKEGPVYEVLEEY